MQFLDLVTQYKSIKKELLPLLKKTLGEGSYILGKEVEEFENAIASYCDVPYAIGVNSGTDALLLSLRALNIGTGDEVITSPFTFIATGEAICMVGAKPVFVDINPASFTIDPERIAKKITSRTKAIIPVHLFGLMADMETISRIVRGKRISIIEDSAQSMGSMWGKRKAGAWGTCSAFSFFPTKNLGAYGDGGMITTQNKTLAKKIRLLRNHGSSPKDKYNNLVLGYNSRLDAIQTIILRVKLPHLDSWIKKKQLIAKKYQENLIGCGDLSFQVSPGNAVHSFHQFSLLTRYRDKLRAFLASQKIPTMSYYSRPLYRQPSLSFLGNSPKQFPHTEVISRRILQLPIYPELNATDQNRIIATVKEFFSQPIKQSRA